MGRRAEARFPAAQFDAQDRWYREHYASASSDIVMIDGEPAGRLYVYRGEAEIRIVDIALLPETASHGAGTALLRDLLAEADAAGMSVTIHVERFNAALRLYERLGFMVAEDKGVYLLLERRRLREHRFVAVGGDRDQEDLDRAHFVVLDAVDPLRERRVRPALEHDRERRAAAGLAGIAVTSTSSASNGSASSGAIRKRSPRSAAKSAAVSVARSRTRRAYPPRSSYARGHRCRYGGSAR